LPWQKKFAILTLGPRYLFLEANLNKLVSPLLDLHLAVMLEPHSFSLMSPSTFLGSQVLLNSILNKYFAF